jgi:hypothetical protein
MIGRNKHLQRIRRAVQKEADAGEEKARAAAAAKADGVPVDAIAEALGFKTRRAVYQLLKRGR